MSIEDKDFVSVADGGASRERVDEETCASVMDEIERANTKEAEIEWDLSLDFQLIFASNNRNMVGIWMLTTCAQ